MEDELAYIDIYYQYNCSDDIKKERLNEIIQNPYFLIESTKNINDLTYDNLESLLVEDGVDKSKIKKYTFRYEIEKEGVTQFDTKPLSKINFQECIKSNKIYLHLIINENDPKQGDPVLKEMEDYNSKIAKAGKKVDSLYKELSGECKRNNCNTISYSIKNK
jgi:hypothetical protein